MTFLMTDKGAVEFNSDSITHLAKMAKLLNISREQVIEVITNAVMNCNDEAAENKPTAVINETPTA